MADACSFEQQIGDLNETIELLTLDKEQLALDKELLEEQLHQIQEEMKASKRSTGSLDAASLQQIAKIQDDNKTLREAVQTLNDSIVTERAKSESLIKENAALHTQVADLCAFKVRAEQEIDEMKQTVDSMSDFESMIENLTSQNLDLNTSLVAAKETIHQLEDAAELTEELDHQQRQQIDDDRKLIDQLNISLQTFERLVADKDTAILDLQKKADGLRQKYITEKQTVEQLQQQLSLGNQDYKQIEDRLREASVIRAQKDALGSEVHSLQTQLLQSQLQKLKFQVQFSRMYEFFGSTSFFIEENKLLTIEILCVHTISMSIEAMKQLSLLLQKSTFLTTSTPSINSEKMPEMMLKLLSLYHLSLPLHAWITHESLIKLTQHASLEIHKNLLSDTSYSTLKVALLQESREILEMGVGVYTRMSPLITSLSGTAAEDNVNNVDMLLLQEQMPMVEEMITKMKTLLMKLASNNNSNVDTAATETGLTTVLESAMTTLLTSTSTKSELAVESLLLSSSAMAETLLFNGKIAGFSAFQLDQIRNVKNAIEDILRHFKVYLASQLTSSEEKSNLVVNAYIELLRLFRASSISKLEVQELTQEDEVTLKSILMTFRTVLNDMNVTPSTQSKTGIVSLKYFPSVILLTGSGSNGQQQSEKKQANCQFIIDKYWSLILQGDNDFISSAVTTQHHKQQQQLAWKERVSYFRTLIMAKLDIDTEMINTKTPFSPNDKAIVTQEKLLENEVKTLKQQLDLKVDEIKAAMNRCEELQQMLDRRSHSVPITAVSSMADLKSAVSDTNDTSTIKLQEEIKALEEALEVMERSYDHAIRENKVLKSNASSSSYSSVAPSLASSSTGHVAAGTGKEAASVGSKALGQRKTSLNVFEATKAMVLAGNNSSNNAAKSLLSIPSMANMTSGSSTPSSAATGLIDASNYASMERNLLDQLRYWKRVALRRMTASLVPLPSVGALRVEDGTTTTIITKDSKLELSVPRIEGGVNDIKAAYYKLRLERVKRVQIPSLTETPAAVSKGRNKGGRGQHKSTLANMLLQIKTIAYNQNQ